MPHSATTVRASTCRFTLAFLSDHPQHPDWRRCSEHIDEFMDRFVVEKTIDDATKRVLDWSAIGAELTELGFMNWDVLSDSGKWGTGRYRIRGFLKAIRGADWEENL